jgi:hypothetical protein
VLHGDASSSYSKTSDKDVAGTVKHSRGSVDTDIRKRNFELRERVIADLI